MEFEGIRDGLQLTRVFWYALLHALHTHTHTPGTPDARYDTTVGAAGDEWYYILGSSLNVTVL